MPIKFSLAPMRRQVFIETGTDSGGGVKKALEAGFRKIITIELDGAKAQKNRRRYHKQIKNGRVVQLHGDSADKLPEAIKLSGNEPITFWLDAHPNTAEGNPLYTELDAIIAASNPQHVIMIDDRRLFTHWGLDETKVYGLLRQAVPDCKIFTRRGFVPRDVLVAAKMDNLEQPELPLAPPVLTD